MCMKTGLLVVVIVVIIVASVDCVPQRRPNDDNAPYRASGRRVSGQQRKNAPEGRFRASGVDVAEIKTGPAYVVGEDGEGRGSAMRDYDYDGGGGDDTDNSDRREFYVDKENRPKPSPESGSGRPRALPMRDYDYDDRGGDSPARDEFYVMVNEGGSRGRKGKGASRRTEDKDPVTQKDHDHQKETTPHKV